MNYFYDSTYFMLVIPTLLLALWAQYRVKSTFAKYSRVRSGSGMSGSDAARAILDANGLFNVRIEHIAGSLTDHFDPKSNVVRLSDSVHSSVSVAAIGVAAHEAGHAVQYAQSYFPMKVRGAIIPLTNIGSTLSIPLIILGSLINWGGLINIGIILFATVALFQIITLPVEFNASRRAIVALEGSNRLDRSEIKGAKKVLSAAAMTYVAALITALAQLLRLVIVFGRRGD